VWDRNSPVIRALPWLLALALLLLILRLAPAGLGHVVPVFLSAIVVAAATAPAADALERYRIPRGVTVLAIYLVVAAVLTGLLVLMTPVAITEIRLARDALPGYGRDFQDFVERIAPGQADQVSVDRLTNRAVGEIGGLLGRATDLALATTTVLVQVIIVLVMAYFMVVEADFAQRVVRRFTPVAHRERTVHILSTIGTKLGQWARAQALLALFFGIAFGVGLRLLGVHYAGTLGLVGAVLEVIPYVGGAVTLILAVMVASSQSPWLILWVIVLYTVIVQIEAHVLAPLLIGKAVGLHPLVVVIALFIGAETLGLLGALLAVPIAVVIQVLLDEFFAATPDILPEVQSPKSKVQSLETEADDPESRVKTPESVA
jgi:predicted PurR-regulated permease PerM